MALPNEDELMAELERLEKSTIRKGGDALQSAPHDGGFATEGTNIQSAAMKKVIKAMVAGGMSKAQAQETAKKAFASKDSDSDSESDNTAKGMNGDEASDDEDDMSGGADGDDSSDDEESPDEPPMSKSLGAAKLANATRGGGSQASSLRKALVDESPGVGDQLDAAPILGQLIDAIDRMARGAGPSKHDIKTIRKSIVRVQEVQNDFNGKLAKALSMIAGRVIATEAIVKAMANEPVINTRAPTLRKGDLSEPMFHGNTTAQIDGRQEASPLHGVEYLKIQEALVDLCTKGLGGIDLLDITKFENSKGDLRMLPPSALKHLEQRLCGAATA